MDGIYQFAARLVRKCRESDDAEMIEILSAHRSECWLPIDSRRSMSAKLDACGVMRFGDFDIPFMAEYERCADSPVFFAQKLRTYMRYYAAALRMEDWFTDVRSLFVFAERIGAAGFAHFCGGELSTRGALARDIPAYIAASDDIASRDTLGMRGCKLGGWMTATSDFGNREGDMNEERLMDGCRRWVAEMERAIGARRVSVVLGVSERAIVDAAAGEE